MINAGDYNKKISIYQIEEIEDNDGFVTKNEVITSYIAKRNQFCILIEGNADLVRYDLNRK